MAGEKKKLMRVSTVPLSLKMFCKELLMQASEDYETLAVSSPGRELDELASCGIPVEAVYMKRNISIVSDIKSLWHLYRVIRRFRPDIVHSLTPKAGLLTMIASWLAGVPVRIHSFTGLLFPTAVGAKKLILKTTDRITCACATHVLSEGQGVRDDLKKSHITSKPLKVLGYGNLRGIDLGYYDKTEQVKLDAEEIRREWEIKEGDFVFVFIGRVVGDKGINELVDAFTRLSQKCGDIHLVLAGPQEPDTDPLASDTLQAIEKCARIHWAEGWMEDVRPYYAMSDILVFPSYREGFPNVVLEAGAMSLPSIVTDINGSREIISDGINGFVVPPKDADALYVKMELFAKDRALARNMSQRCRKVIEDRYDARYVRKCLLDFYKSL